MAEEYATADVISRGRLEIGFVKSGGSEMASDNANPVQQHRALLGGDRPHHQGADPPGGPVQLGGQALHAPPRQHLAAARGSSRIRGCGRRPAIRDTAAEVGRRGMVNVLVLRGPEGTRRAWAALSRRRARRPGLPKVTHRQLRLRGASSTSATRTRRACGSAASSCGSSTPASSRRRSTRSSCPAPRRRRSRRRYTGHAGRRGGRRQKAAPRPAREGRDHRRPRTPPRSSD